MQIRSKIWLEVDGEAVFGSGRRALLEGIIKYGSINRAAKEINISYRKALSYIQSMERRLGLPLVERKTGGRNGGGAALTKNAEVFLVKYKKLEEGVTEIIDSKFSGIFGASKSLKRSTGKKIR
ncbi:MAG: LysR family transcriptional regulator [Nitrospirae bacterium]|nr:LysR family transcriptional regulator [Nitrospirota bacterium]